MATTTIASTDAGCGCDCGPGHEHCDDPAGRARTRFFRDQLVAAEDLVQGQRYLREKHRRHNRLMHGWGVVCGVGVRTAGDGDGKPLAYTVCVAPGYVLGPYGDEIVVGRTVRFDVRELLQDAGAACPPPVDPWCSAVRVDPAVKRTLYLAIRYEECPARPVQTQSGCGCGTECEYSRIVDGFGLAVLEELPEAYVNDRFADPEADRGKLLREMVLCTAGVHDAGRPCPACPTSPWIILADLEIGLDGVVDVDQWAHRRMVAAFGRYGFYCAPAAPDPLPG